MKKFLPNNKSSAFSFQLSDKKRLALNNPELVEGKSKGFTLVELLVVISIIAILSVIGMAVFTNTQKNARDARRRADIDAISKAYEANYTSGVAKPYVAPDVSWFVSGKYTIDPSSGSNYYWGGSQTIPTVSAGTAPSVTYTICAKLENANGNSSTSGDGTTFTAASGAAATYYCGKSQQ